LNSANREWATSGSTSVLDSSNLRGDKFRFGIGFFDSTNSGGRFGIGFFDSTNSGGRCGIGFFDSTNSAGGTPCASRIKKTYQPPPLLESQNLSTPLLNKKI
jgi:hypothetical protein